MTRSHTLIVLLLGLGVGIYGCARNPSEGGTGRNSPQEAKAQRWEEDYRAAAAARDQYRQKLLAAEEKQAQLQGQLDHERAAATAERDALKAELRTRTAEREALITQYDGFRRNLKELLAQAETSLANPGTPGTPNIPSIPTIPLPPTTTTPALIGSQSSPSTPTGSALSN